MLRLGQCCLGTLGSQDAAAGLTIGIVCATCGNVSNHAPISLNDEKFNIASSSWAGCAAPPDEAGCAAPLLSLKVLCVLCYVLYVMCCVLCNMGLVCCVLCVVCCVCHVVLCVV